jgi:hypothetical protein
VQAAVLKEYPNSMIVTVAQCMFSTVQSFIVAVIAERDFSRWKLRFDFSLLAILYNVCSAFIFLFLSFPIVILILLRPYILFVLGIVI